MLLKRALGAVNKRVGLVPGLGDFPPLLVPGREFLGIGNHAVNLCLSEPPRRLDCDGLQNRQADSPTFRQTGGNSPRT